MLEKLEVERVEFVHLLRIAQDELPLEGKALRVPMEYVGWPGWYEAAQVTDVHRHQTR